MPHAYITRATFDAQIARTLNPKSKPMTPRAAEGLRALLNQAVWRIACRLLDGARILAGSHVVKPDDVYNLLRISVLMQMPLEDDPLSRRLASSKAAASMNKGMQTASGGGSGSTVLPGAYFEGGGGGAGSTVLPAAYFEGGGGSSELLTDAAMLAVLKEYRSRVTTPVRISEAARGVMRKHIESNVLAIVHECKGRPGALKSVSARWVTHM
jgi:hypothetical protein